MEGSRGVRYITVHNLQDVRVFIIIQIYITVFPFKFIFPLQAPNLHEYPVYTRDARAHCG